jgi:hypothetical protein
MPHQNAALCQGAPQPPHHSVRKNFLLPVARIENFVAESIAVWLLLMPFHFNSKDLRVD